MLCAVPLNVSCERNVINLSLRTIVLQSTTYRNKRDGRGISQGLLAKCSAPLTSCVSQKRSGQHPHEVSPRPTIRASQLLCSETRHSLFIPTAFTFRGFCNLPRSPPPHSLNRSSSGSSNPYSCLLFAELSLFIIK